MQGIIIIIIIIMGKILINMVMIKIVDRTHKIALRHLQN